MQSKKHIFFPILNAHWHLVDKYGIILDMALCVSKY